MTTFQVANLDRQKQALERALAVEKNRAADVVRQSERRLHDFQEQLVIGMKEVNVAREQHVPLRAEIEALKALLADEERRWGLY